MTWRFYIMRIFNIASGSSGNCTYIGTSSTHILIDSGISKKRIQEGLNKADLSLNDIDAILITHEHSDHISSIGVVEKAANIPIYATKGTIEGINNCYEKNPICSDLFNEISTDVPFNIKDIKFCALKTSHDANQSVCYKFECNDKKAAIVTDLGIYDDYLINNLNDLNFLMLESNHDVRMLEVGPYPYFLKQRILGNRGHLSNELAGQFLDKILNDNINEILLAHLSKENNTKDLAQIAVENEIDFSDSKYKSKDFNINVASQNECSKIFVL